MIENVIIPSPEEGPSREECLLGAICYGPFGFVVPIFLQKQSDFLSFHTKQGTIIFLAWLIIDILPVPGLFGIFTLAYIGLAGFAGWKAYNGEKYMYPFIEKLLENFKK